MANSEREKVYREYLKGELAAAALYNALAQAEKDPERANIFRHLVQAELRHASRWAEKLGLDPAAVHPSTTSPKLLLVKWAARMLGTARITPLLLRGEARDISTYSADPEARDLVKDERSHSRTLLGLAGIKDPLEAMRAENSGVAGNSGNLRAAVLGVNDGLVSNFSLVMGVAGGVGESRVVLLAGVAGLLAGAFSMAAGEYVSVRSQREVYENLIRRERVELKEWPEEEEEELTLIYQAKGLSQEEARQVARKVMADPEKALDTMAREELGLDPAQLGSPWGNSLSSFGAFVAGALVPVLPYVFGVGKLAFFLSGICSAVALVGVGGLLAWMSNRSAVWGALRMLLAGGSAAAVTYGVGRLLGMSIDL
ncbi:MAG: VIT1/CCC1 transporter family protein [Chloroflexi bacterium]|nr:VIT1/CCC1 transporter family protein [Chloroflexota bacterium]